MAVLELLLASLFPVLIIVIGLLFGMRGEQEQEITVEELEWSIERMQIRGW
jgi:hypothetical protein